MLTYLQLVRNQEEDQLVGWQVQDLKQVVFEVLKALALVSAFSCLWPWK